MMSLHSSTHSSQMNTLGPAISLRTSCWLLPQKEQYRILLLSPERPWRPSVMLLLPWWNGSESRISQAGRGQDPARQRPGRGVKTASGQVSGGLDGVVGARADDRVHHTVGLGFFGRHEVVALDVAFDLLDRLPGVGGQLGVQALAQEQDFLGLDGDVGR